MEKGLDYDLVVIGAGIAGLVSAVTANSLGLRVAIIEKRRFGGNCGSFTCLPSKTLIRAGHISRLVSHMEHFGLKSAGPINLDMSNVMTHVRSVVQQAYEKDMPETFDRIGIKTIKGLIKAFGPIVTPRGKAPNEVDQPVVHGAPSGIH